ncbi:MAG: septal ring lytic transglycosylase RlpA family protein [Chloroflexota bacterium]
MRLPRVVARAALIAALASVVVPGLAGSRIPSAPTAIDPATFQQVGLARSETSMTTQLLDLDLASEGRLDAASILSEPRLSLGLPFARPAVTLPASSPIVKILWHLDHNISWYGPGFYGNGGACGMMPGGMTKDTVGVAHRTLPCGTRVTFRYNGRTVTTRVIDRGPYVAGRTWDMTHGLCALLNHCFTGGGVYWKIG